MIDPYATPSAELDTVSLIEAKRYGGIGRLVYFCVLVVVVAVPALIAKFGGEDIFLAEGAFALLRWGLVAGAFIATYFRLKNIGMMPWLALLILIPIINLFIGVRCLLFQEGYVDSKKLDDSGRAASYLVISVVGLSVVLGVIYFVRM